MPDVECTETPVEPLSDWGHGGWPLEEHQALGRKKVASLKESAERVAKGLVNVPPMDCYAVTRLALTEAFDGNIENAPVPNCAHVRFYDPVTDNYFVVRAPDDLSDDDVPRFIEDVKKYFKATDSVVYRTKRN